MAYWIGKLTDAAIFGIFVGIGRWEYKKTLMAVLNLNFLKGLKRLVVLSIVVIFFYWFKPVKEV